MRRLSNRSLAYVSTAPLGKTGLLLRRRESTGDRTGSLTPRTPKGTFALHGLPTRGSRVFALAEGYRGRVLALERDPGDITFELHPPAAIEGTLATEVGLPAAGTVGSRVTPTSRRGIWLPPPLRSIQLGSRWAAMAVFALRTCNQARTRWRQARRKAQSREHKVTIGDEDPSQRVMMLVEHAGSISGTVSGLTEGETVAVSVVPEAAAGGDLFVTDVGNGGYTLAGVQDGPARVRATTKSRAGFRSS